MSKKGPRVIKAAWTVPTGVEALQARLGTVATGPAPATLVEARLRARALEERAHRLLLEAEEAAAARLEEAEREAESLREAARQEAAAAAESLRRAAQAEAESIRARAREEGLALGRREAEAAVRAEMEAEVARAREVAAAELAAAREEAAAIRKAAAAERQERLAQLEPELVALALDIARQILQAEIAARPEAVLGMVAKALGKVQGAEQVRLRLAPRTLATLEESRSQGGTPFGSDLEVLADPALDPGDFVIHSDQGMIDGRIAAQVRQVAAALQELLPEEEANPPASPALGADAARAERPSGPEPGADG